MDRYPSICAELLYKHAPNLKPPSPFPKPTPLNASSSPSAEIVAAREQNLSKSLFCRLPLEVLLMIWEYVGEQEDEVVMALRGTCSHFATLLDDPTSKRENICQVEKWRRNYTKRRRAFQRKELVRRERDGELSNGELMCNFCLTTHPHIYFTPTSIRQPPSTRSCIPSMLRLRVCLHTAIPLPSLSSPHWKPGLWCGHLHSQHPSYLQECGCLRTTRILQDAFIYSAGLEYWVAPKMSLGLLSTEGGGRGVRVGVVGQGVDEEGRVEDWQAGEGWGWGGGERGGSMNDALFGGERVAEREVVVRAEIVLFRCGMEVVVDGRRVREEVGMLARDGNKGMEGRELCMCPHLTLDVVEDMLEKDPYADCPNLSIPSTSQQRHGVDTIPCLPPTPPAPSLLSSSSLIALFFTQANQEVTTTENWPCGHKYHCPNEVCRTYFYFYRARYTRFEYGWKDELVLCVVRNLGACRDAFDKRWMVQLEDQDAVEMLMGEKDTQGSSSDVGSEDRVG